MIANINDLHHYRLRPSDLLRTPDDTLRAAKMGSNVPGRSAPASGGIGCVGELARIRADMAELIALVKATQLMVARLQDQPPHSIQKNPLRSNNQMDISK